MKEYGIWEPMVVKAQTIKTAVESACLLLRVDDIVSGVSCRHGQAPAKQAAAPEDQPDDDQQPER
jgi:T-complex protein 1 subunit gamma